MKTKKLRPLGDVTADMELLLMEMTDDHKLQKGEVLALINAWIDIHAQHCIEVYTVDESSPEFYYGPKK